MTEKSEELGYAVVGQNVDRYDALEKVTGLGKFSSDMYFPGMLCGKILRSPHGYARILSIDTSKAKALPGVESVITAEDVSQKVMWFPDRLLFATDYVRHNGEPVAAVAAVTEEIAEQALDLIEVEYEPLQGVYSKEDSLKPGAPELVPGGNEPEQYKFLYKWDDPPNDIEEGFAQSDLILEGDYTIHNAAGAAQGCGAATNYWDTDGNLRMWISAQGADRAVSGLASFFGLPHNKVLVDSTHSYGSFGPSQSGKEETWISASLAKETGKPVMLQLSKEEELRDHHTNPDSTMHLKMGFTNDGLIQVLHIVGLWGNGSSGSASGPMMNSQSRGPFYLHYVPIVQSEGSMVWYNTNRRGNYRGYGCINNHFAIEQMIDEAAEILGIHPVDMHLINKIKTGDRIMRASHRGPDTTLSCTDMDSCINKSADSVDFRNRWRGYTTPVSVDGPKKRGISIADFIHGCHARGASAAVKVSTTGTVELYCCIPDPGTGCKSVMAQFVAEELGVLYEDVRIVSDSSMPPGGGCFSSRATISVGWPVTLAARDAKQHILAEAAHLLEVTPEELESKNREIYVKADPTKKVPFAEACSEQIVGWSTYEIDETLTSPRNFGTDCYEVEVDTETGEIVLKKASVSNDCGVAVNPKALISNMTGGQTQGIGYTLMEGMVYDQASGILLSNSALNYKIPTSLDMPQELFDMILVEPYDPQAPFGAKGASEGIMDPVAAVIANAVYNACGVRIKETPLTPDKILRALGKI